jgi:hypothetical protein
MPTRSEQSSNGGWPVARLGGGRDDVRLRSREASLMKLEHVDGIPAHEDSAVSRFVEAVRTLSDDPRPETVAGYLIASRALEDFRSSGIGRAADDERRAAA